MNPRAKPEIESEKARENRKQARQIWQCELDRIPACLLGHELMQLQGILPKNEEGGFWYSYNLTILQNFRGSEGEKREGKWGLILLISSFRARAVYI